ENRLRARRRAQRREERAHHRRPRAQRAAARGAHRPGCWHTDQKQVMRVARLAPSRRVWIFDLDNTLHDARARIFPAMHDQINAFLQREFGVDEEGANRMRQEFWLRYGTTLNGLMRHHGIHPRRFLAETHVFPELGDLVVHENALKHALGRLGGMKLVFSNAPRHYVEWVLRAIGLARYFDAVYSIEDARYRGKPALHGFRMLLRKHNLDPHRCAF